MSIGGRSESIGSVLSIIGVHIKDTGQVLFCVFMGRNGGEANV